MDIKPGSYRKGGECEGDGEAIRTNKRQIIAPGRSGPRGEDAVCHAESSSNEHRGERLLPRLTRQLRAKWKSADEGLGWGGQLASTPTRKIRDSLKERWVFSVDLEFRQYDDWTGATDRRKTIRMRKVEHTARGHMRRAGERMRSRQPQLIPTQESNDRQGHAIRTLSLLMKPTALGPLRGFGSAHTSNDTAGFDGPRRTTTWPLPESFIQLEWTVSCTEIASYIVWMNLAPNNIRPHIWYHWSDRAVRQAALSIDDIACPW